MTKDSSLSWLQESGAFTIGGFPLIELDRNPIDPHILRGFVLALNAKLTLLQEMDDHQFRLRGYAVFRNSDVKRWRPIQAEEFFAKAAKFNRLRPSQPAKITIASMAGALSSAGTEFPLLTIHQERIKRGVCYVGRFLRVTQRRLTLRSISPEGEWEERESFLLDDITLLEFGGPYEKLLALMSQTCGHRRCTTPERRDQRRGEVRGVDGISQ